MSASGMPIISTYHCDIPEVVVDGESGLLVPERDVDALAERLEYLVNHPEKWEEMGRAGRQHIEAEYDVRKQVPKLEKLYAKAL
jgi:colanic acid/amylovoran biosynthesis glycosyltransferase